MAIRHALAAKDFEQAADLIERAVPEMVRSRQESTNPESEADLPVTYQIRLKGHLGHHGLGWFEGLSIILAQNGETLLTGSVVDQAALYGLLRQIRDLGMPLLSVTRVDSNQPDNPNNSGAL